MDDLTEREQPGMQAVEDALRTYPIEPYPASLLPAIMIRIEARKPVVQFRLTALDYAISLLAAGLAALVLLFWASFQQRPDWLAWLRAEFLSVWLPIQLSPPVISVAVLGSLALCMLGLAAAWTLFAHDRAIRQV